MTVNKTSRIARNTAGTWRLFQSDAVRVNRYLYDVWDALIQWLFAFNQRGAARRMAFFFAATIVLWLILGMLTNPIQISEGRLFNQLFEALFQRSVLRSFLVLSLGLGVGMILASTFLDDIFELNDLSVAERFLTQAVFTGASEVIRIRDGSVDPMHSNSPLIRIGGPGLVDVHLENLALFEKPDGAPHVIGPTQSSRSVLDGFERLREVVDLRDQVIDLTLTGRTKDGVPVTAKDVQLVFSVVRGKQNPNPDDSFSQPYPFSEDAIRNLVYKQGGGTWIEAMRNMIRSELMNFISQHMLSDFLSYPTGAAQTSSFVSRDQITNLFYDFAAGFTQRSEANGVTLHWIGVGTWMTPSELIPDRHIEAWRLSNENRALSSEGILEQIRQESRLDALLRQVDDVLSSFYIAQSQGASVEATLRSLLLSYREKLRAARELYETHNQPEPPELHAVLRHLDLLGAVRPAKNDIV